MFRVALSAVTKDVHERSIAHVRRNEDGSFVIHDLEDHLRAVAGLAGEFASTFGHAEWGQLAGLWHDLGKYSLPFQNYIVRRNERAAWRQRAEQ